MGKKSPNKRKSDGTPNTGQTPKKMKFAQPNTEGSSKTVASPTKSPQKFNPSSQTPKSAQKFNPPNETAKSTEKFNPENKNKTPKSAQKFNLGNKTKSPQNKTPQSGNKNNYTPNSKKNNQTPNSNKKNNQKTKTPLPNKKQLDPVDNSSPKGGEKIKLKKFSGTAQLESEDESDYEVEQIIKPEKISKTMNEFKDSDEEEDESSNDMSQETVENSSGDENVSDDDVSNEETENAKNENNENDKKASKKEKVAESSAAIQKKLQTFVSTELKKGPPRYVLFIGNLSYDSTIQEVTDHFSKICKVKHVRLPKGQDNKMPRGFGYVDVEDETSYLKGLSLHHSFLKGRRINVEYTSGKNKNSAERKKLIKSKNFKLNAMRKAGQLGQNKKPSQMRSVRRAKKRMFDKMKEEKS